MIEPSNISFCHGSIHIADDNFIGQAVQVDFCPQTHTFCLKLNSISSMPKLEFSQSFWGGVKRLEIAIFVNGEILCTDQRVINFDWNVLIFYLPGEGAKASQEGTALELLLRPLHHNDVANAGNKRRLLISLEENRWCFLARCEHCFFLKIISHLEKAYHIRKPPFLFRSTN